MSEPHALAAVPRAADGVDALWSADAIALAEKVVAYAEVGEGSANTKRAYLADWKTFVRWSAATGQGWDDGAHAPRLPLAPSVVASYIAFLADRPRGVRIEERATSRGHVEREREEGPAHVSTISRALVMLRRLHKMQGFDDPTSTLLVERVWKGVRRTHGTRRTHQKRELAVDDLALAARALAREHRAAEQAARASTAVGNKAVRARSAARRRAALLRYRDDVVLLLGWSGALRRSELVAIDVEDVSFVARGAEIVIRRSKTNQYGAYEVVRITYARDPALCAVRALRRWLRVANLRSGAVVRSVSRHGTLGERLHAASVATIVKAAAAAAGLDVDAFAAHSLRSGWITSAMARRTHSEQAVMEHSRHKSIAVFRGYVRIAQAWDDHPTLGLL